jgi:type IV fimbrial biogenesis protein FimT
MPLVEKHTITNKAGFTLLELMIVVAIAAILMGIAIPSFMEAIRSNRLTTYANELVTALNLARSEAVKRGLTVAVRRVDNLSSTNLGAGANWEDGWDVFVDLNGNGSFNDDGDGTLCELNIQNVLIEDCLLKTYTALRASYTLRGDANFTASVTYMPSGRSNSNGIFALCDDSDGLATPSANTSRLLIVNQVGRVSMGVDTDNNQIPENAGVDLATCNP